MNPAPGPLIVATFVLLGSSTGVSAQPDATLDALARAAFCIGVLTESQQFAQMDPTAGLAAYDNGCWQRGGDASIDACLARARRAADVILAQSQQRYAKYLEIHAQNRRDPQVAIMMAMGKSAARASREKDDGLEGRCALECGGSQMPASQNKYDDCLIPCIERSDQEQASALRCVISPDHLPF
jgi:hypothetical protein